MPHRIFAWAILIFFFSAAPAWSWSAKGHRIVGAIADEVLKKNPTTKAKVKDILGGHTLATVSVWADCAKGFMYCQRPPTPEEQAYAGKNPERTSLISRTPISMPAPARPNSTSSMSSVMRSPYYAGMLWQMTR